MENTISAATDDTEETPEPEIPQSEVSKEDLLASLASIARKEEAFGNTMRLLQEAAFSPEFTKHFRRRWRISQVAEMVGFGVDWIRKHEASGKLPAPAKDEHGKRKGYSLDHINRIRDFFKTRRHRQPDEDPVVVSFSTFKGGCGKSTLSVHFAQYLALRGYRVLVLDCDPQGSTSTLFGCNRDLQAALQPPDADPKKQKMKQDFGLEDFLAGETEQLSKCVRVSYFPGIDIVPAGLDLFNIEYGLAEAVYEDPSYLNVLRDGIRSVWGNYDVIVIDPPPALGFLSLSVLNAANALVIPMRPTLVDFASTKIFLTMLRSNVSAMITHDFPIYYHFEALLINHMDEAKSAHVDITAHMRTLFGAEDFLSSTMKDSAEIDNAGKDMMTVYDLTEPKTSHKTYQRCVSYLNSVNREIETRIRRTWPSHREALREEAQI